jgi:GT2 family glycosyltransferase
LAEKGYRLVFAPDALVYHRHNPTLRAYVRRKFYVGYWKALIARAIRCAAMSPSCYG